MNKVLIMPLKWHGFFEQLKIDEQRFLYIDPWIYVNSQNSWEIIKDLGKIA